MAGSIDMIHPGAFDFFRFLSLADDQEAIRFSPTEQTTFPQSAIEAIHWNANSQCCVSLNFMTCLGVDSPLSEAIKTDLRLRPLLKVFNEKLYAILHATWKRYHTITVCPWVPKSALTSHYVLNRLRRKIPDLEITIRENIPCWIPIEEVGDQLGVNAVLGDRVLSAGEHIQITVTLSDQRREIRNTLLLILRDLLGARYTFTLIIQICCVSLRNRAFNSLSSSREED